MLDGINSFMNWNIFQTMLLRMWCSCWGKKRERMGTQIAWPVRPRISMLARPIYYWRGRMATGASSESVAWIGANIRITKPPFPFLFNELWANASRTPWPTAGSVAEDMLEEFTWDVFEAGLCAAPLENIIATLLPSHRFMIYRSKCQQCFTSGNYKSYGTLSISDIADFQSSIDTLPITRMVGLGWSLGSVRPWSAAQVIL